MTNQYNLFENLDDKTRERVTGIIDEMKSKLPEDIKIEITQEFIDSVKSTLDKPEETWEQTIKKNVMRL